MNAPARIDPADLAKVQRYRSAPAGAVVYAEAVARVTVKHGPRPASVRLPGNGNNRTPATSDAVARFSASLASDAAGCAWDRLVRRELEAMREGLRADEREFHS
jgi:hypothetical protein